MLQSQRSRILAAVAGITFLTTGTLMLTAQWQAQRTLAAIQQENAHNLLTTVTNMVENEHQSILFYKDKLVERRKGELKDIVDVAVEVLRFHHDKAVRGELTSEEAMEMAKEQIKRMRYANGVGYLWINDTTRPYPVMIMHPTLPDLDGQILDKPEYNCALGRDENLFRAFNDVCSKSNAGYVDYLWPKPTTIGLTERQPKLSYVRLFKPWNWIIGTGVYIDDIERDTGARVEAVLNELRNTFLKTSIQESGYMFIFTGDKRMLIHPKLEGKDVRELRNPDTNQFMLDEIALASKTEHKSLDYRWVKPRGGPKEFFWKRMYANHFEPLDWYICVSYYVDETERPAWDLGKRMFTLSCFLLAIAFFVSSLLSKSLSTPLRKLAAATEMIDQQGISHAEIPITGSLETRELGQVLARALNAVHHKELSLRESRERLRITLDSIGDAVIATDIEGRIVRMNRVAEELMAWSFEDARRHVLLDGVKLVDPRTGDPLDNPINRVLQHGQRYDMKNHAVMIAHNGERRLVADCCSPIHDSEGVLVGVVMVFRDVTERLQMEEERRQAQKMDSLGLLAGGVAHDFNNMLAGIMASAEILSSKETDGEKLKYAELIVRTCDKAAGLTEKLLAFSRKGRVLSAPIDTHSAINDSIAILQHSIDKRIEIVARLCATNSVIMGDSTQIQNMVLNLGVNASHAMPSGGVLTISTSNTLIDEITARSNTFEVEPGEYVDICIADTGVGISREALHRVFEPFFTTKGVGEGTGLGLAAVYGTVKEHHGAITVQSELNQGTVFHVYLPTTDTDAVHGHGSTDQIARGKGYILVVDDESVIRTATEKSLLDMGYSVCLACDGREGLSVYQERGQQIDLVILDMVMPNMNGPDCFRAIRRIDPEAKVLIASGFVRDEDVTALKKEGLLGFIKKPYRQAQLSRLLREFV